ncbi:octaprenyl-diphosphate synthase domain protein [Rickettsia felis str. Pedreira]|uniref:Octaprenyl-diphosphate synthase domain protein n=1 Tax=Rickettsia felis str. Pedreira TaxID=1359196 RepID=A0A0F3MT02_RICFI|nr:octaprenyl-diphosphate synthase domain protein [Rickettsia felis str. Pedreira]
MAISGLWHEIASSKFSIFPRNDGKTYPYNNAFAGVTTKSLFAYCFA